MSRFTGLSLPTVSKYSHSNSSDIRHPCRELKDVSIDKQINPHEVLTANLELTSARMRKIVRTETKEVFILD